MFLQKAFRSFNIAKNHIVQYVDILLRGAQIINMQLMVVELKYLSLQMPFALHFAF